MKLALERCDEALIAALCARKDQLLERNVSIVCRVEHAIDDRHAAAAELGLDHIPIANACWHRCDRQGCLARRMTLRDGARHGIELWRDRYPHCKSIFP